MIQAKDILTFGLASIALIVSLATLYFTHLRAARVQIIAGEYLNIGHFSEGNFNISLAITFLNYGARIAIVRRLALLVHTPNAESYLLEPCFFQQIDETGNFLHEATAGPFGLPSRESITKQVLFRS